MGRGGFHSRIPPFMTHRVPLTIIPLTIPAFALPQAPSFVLVAARRVAIFMVKKCFFMTLVNKTYLTKWPSTPVSARDYRVFASKRF